MSAQSVTEILAAHADHLNRGENVEPQSLLAGFSGQRGEVATLMTVAAQLKSVLTPTLIAPRFRVELHDELVMAARHRASQKFLIELREPAWGWLIGAAAIGSAAGLIAFALRAKHSRQMMTPAASETIHTN
jgi:hypothetical protein